MGGPGSSCLTAVNRSYRLFGPTNGDSVPLITVLVVDGLDLVRAGIVALLNAAHGLTVVADAANGDDAVRCAGPAQPDVIVTELRLPDVDGVTAARRILAANRQNRPRVLVLTADPLDDVVDDALRAGVRGFLHKDSTPEELVAAIVTVAHGSTLLPASVAQRMLQAQVPSPHPRLRQAAALNALTDRERVVLRLTGAGLTNQDIAARLTITEATVKTHLNRTMTKLGLATRAQAVVAAYETGLIISPHHQPALVGAEPPRIDGTERHRRSA